MDLRQLRYFTVLAETRNFHRAAERLNISQPPLSVAIRKLEEGLGTPLFERGPRGVRLTPAGEAALAPARETLVQAELVAEAVRLGAKGETGRLAIGFVGSAVSELLPRLILAYRARYPKVELVLEEMTSVGILDALQQRQLDIGLVRLPAMKRTDAMIQVIEHDRMVAAIPRSHPLARRKSLALAELAQQPFVVHGPVSVLHTVIMLACQQAGFVPMVTQEVTQVQAVLSLVQSGLGVALLPARMSRFAPESVALLPLREPVAIEMGLAVSPDAGPAVANFVSVAMAASDIE